MTKIEIEESDREAFVCYSLVKKVVAEIPFDVSLSYLKSGEISLLTRLINSYYDLEYKEDIVELALGIVLSMPLRKQVSLEEEWDSGKLSGDDWMPYSLKSLSDSEDTESILNYTTGDAFEELSGGSINWFRSN